MAETGVYVPLSAVFPEATANFTTFRTLIRSLSRTDTLFWCARLNLVISNPMIQDPKRRQAYGIGRFFDDAEIERIHRFTAQHGGADRVSVFFRGQLLEVIRWTCLLAEDHPGDGDTYSDPTVRRRFAQATLMASDLWARRVFKKDVFSTSNGVANPRAIPAMREAIRTNKTATELSRVLARGVSLYRGPFQERYKSAEQEFLKATGLTLDQYMMCLCAVTIHFGNVDPEEADRNPGLFSLDATKRGRPAEVAAALDLYFRLETQTADDLRETLWSGRRDADGLTGAEPFDENPLRERPIFRTSDGRGIILDLVCLNEKTSVGPLFALAKALRGTRRVNEVFGAFGSAVEEYVNGLLAGMYPSRPPLLPDRLICNPEGETRTGERVEIADACVIDVAEAILFETKATFVRDDVAASDDIEGYLDELRRKYALSPGTNSDRKVKGVAQLGRWIRRIATGDVTLAGRDWERVRCVYPVLVAYDESIDTPGHSEFFGMEFVRAFEPDEVRANGYMRKGSLTVAPLAVGTVEDLENLESSVENFRLVDLLNDYARPRPGVRPSLHDFMASVEGQGEGKYKFIRSRELADRAQKVLEEFAGAMFPGVAFPIAPLS